MTYHITLKNPGGKSRGVSRLLVDGREVPGNLIPWLESGEHGRSGGYVAAPLFRILLYTLFSRGIPEL